LVISVPGTATKAQDEQTPGASRAELKLRAKEYFPKKIEELKERIRRFRIVTRPNQVLDEYPENPALFIAINSFYGYIEKRELDIYQEQEGIPRYFPVRDEYYEFLDTMLPAMRDRKFERNRLLTYDVHAIDEVEGKRDEVMVTMSITSDDTFPFGKIMVYKHRWIYGIRGWYPGKIEAEPATYWERIR